MLLSMTGYGSDEVDISFDKDKKISLALELKSINSRFFEFNSRLPSMLGFLEGEVAFLFKKKLIRGRIYLTVSSVGSGGEVEIPTPSFTMAKAYICAAKAIQKKFGLAGKLALSDILSLPNLFTLEKLTIDTASKKQFLKSIEKVADKLIESRMAEGANLKKDLIKRFDFCRKAINKIDLFYEKLMKDQKKLIAKTSLSMQEGCEESKSLLEEMYSTLNKIDIHEEIVRFKSHLDNIRKVLESKEREKGRRLDFILQELSREINTISAKGSNFEINSLAVDIKVELEKVREQLQNIL